MKTIELLEENPHAANVIREYYIDLMINSLDDSKLPEDFKEFVREQGVDNGKIAEMIDANPRNLFDTLDDNGLVISITYDVDFKKFTFYINNDDLKIVCNSRREAEYDAFKIAFLRLQNKLNPQPSAELYEED